MKKTTLIFDFDGTIADTFPFMMSINNILAQEFNFRKVEPHDLEMMKGLSLKENLKFLNIPLLKVPVILAKAQQELHKSLHLVNPISKLKETLFQLKSLGVPLGILSSNSIKNVNQFLKRHNLELFDFIHTSSKLWGKHAGIKRIIKHHQLDSKNIIYVGDETRDIEASQKINIRVAAVTWGYNSKDILKKYMPDYLINQPKELLDLIH